ncbi:MAG: hypothetical protein GOP50_13455, partial [Candidatus Heimdallarchaeota archaeon]|nr:hypothetical protein [Candidatus Heimdallarchaeota archaeon]
MSDEKQQKNVDEDIFQQLQQQISQKNVDKDDNRYEEMKDSYAVSSYYAKSKLREEEPELADA